MDFFEKLDELHAKSVTPEEFEEMNGVSQEETLRKVMDFVDQFEKAQAKEAIFEIKVRKAVKQAVKSKRKAGIPDASDMKKMVDLSKALMKKPVSKSGQSVVKVTKVTKVKKQKKDGEKGQPK